MRLVATLVGALIALGSVASAHAATVSATTGASGAFGVSAGSVLFEASPGEGNRVSMHLIADSHGVVEVRDDGAPLAVGARCELERPGVAHCDTAADFSDAMVNLGDGDDSVTIDDPLYGRVNAGPGDDTVLGACQASGDVGDDRLVGCGNVLNSLGHSYLGGSGNDSIDGGPADDSINGGGGRDVLRGGGGKDDITDGDGAVGEAAPDVIDGGEGSDTVVYKSRTGPVHVDLALGTTGEGDVLDAVESVTSGSGGDILLGTGDANRLDAGRGRDTLDGRNGDDVLLDGSGSDKVTGGAGDDYIVTRDVYRDTVDCGGGTDQLLSDRGDGIAPGCERVTTDYRLVSFDRLGAANRRVSFRVRCLETDELAREFTREFEPCAFTVALRFRVGGRLMTVARGRCYLQGCSTLVLRRDAWRSLLRRRRVTASVEFSRIPSTGTLRHVDRVTLKVHRPPVA
jgi:hypothetical protein